MKRSTAVSLTLLAGALLGGCNSTFQADVRNQTPQPIYAELYREDGPGRSQFLARERIAPGDRASVATYRIPQNSTVVLSVDTVGNPTHMQRVSVVPGTTIVVVTQQGQGQTGPLSLEVLPR